MEPYLLRASGISTEEHSQFSEHVLLFVWEILSFSSSEVILSCGSSGQPIIFRGPETATLTQILILWATQNPDGKKMNYIDFDVSRRFADLHFVSATGITLAAPLFLSPSFTGCYMKH